jgi:hypothetical protein
MRRIPQHADSHPTVLIAVPVIEFKPNETMGVAKPLTKGKFAGAPVPGHEAEICCTERSPRYWLTAV